MFPPRRSLFTLGALSTFVLPAQVPRTFEPRVFGGYTAGLEAAKLEVDSGDAFHQLPWMSISGDVGASLIWRDRWSLAVQGGLSANGFRFHNKDVTFSAYHLQLRPEVRLCWQVPYGENGDRWLRIGLSGGWSMQRLGYYWKEQDDFRGHSDADPQQRPFLAPEIGITQEHDRHRLEVGVRYLRHLDRSPAMSTVLLLPGAASHATHTHDQVVVVMRYHLGFHRAQRTPPAPPPFEFATRETDTLVALYTRNSTVTLRVRDNAESDGDTISILLNGEPVVTSMELTKDRAKVVLPLVRGMNTVMLIADNEGRVPPNTALCRVRGTRPKAALLLRTSLTRNQLITIFRR